MTNLTVIQGSKIKNFRSKVADSPAFVRIKHEWNENPLIVIGVFSGLLVAFSKVVESVGSVQSKRAYSRQIDRRIKVKK